MYNDAPDSQSTARPVARWITVREAGRNRLVMSWSVPVATPAAAVAPVAVPVPSAA
jgi:hypothetical protein